MTINYADVATSATQKERAREDQVKNTAGGYVWELDPWKRLDRFLILGTEGGTFYIKERALTRENAENISKLIKRNGARVVNRAVEISQSGRAHKNDPALFVMALASVEGDTNTRIAVARNLHKVARIGTHLFTFIDYRQTLGGGWGRLMREAVSDWYLKKPLDKVAYQAIKYRQRGGWTHRDVLRKSHPVADTPERSHLFNWIVSGEFHPDLPDQVAAFMRVQSFSDVDDVVTNIVDHDLPREAIPTEFLKNREVWEALLINMPMTAMIRNLTNMTRIGLIETGSDAARTVADRLRDEKRLAKARIHPLSVLLALRTYQRGPQGGGYNYYGTRYGVALDYSPVSRVSDALEDAFYLSFDNVVPTGKNILLALDVSGSMGQFVPGTSITCAEGTAALAMVTARTEQNYEIRGFADAFRNLNITAKDSLDSASQKALRSNFGGTDCALPMLWAKDNNLKFDAFVVYTDSETWAGRRHPYQALIDYRKSSGSMFAKLVVVGMVGNRFTIADPNDAGMLDVVGFDASMPALLADFIRE